MANVDFDKSCLYGDATEGGKCEGVARAEGRWGCER